MNDLQEVLKQLKGKLDKAADKLQAYNIAVDNGHSNVPESEVEAELKELQELEDFLRRLGEGSLQADEL